ncbi:MAG: hypothetical protein HWE20_08670 [Gammaproteobacteria bacterium]|nr:hypothetical protein [Gammaproteobacteria bacterium]
MSNLHQYFDRLATVHGDAKTLETTAKCVYLEWLMSLPSNVTPQNAARYVLDRAECYKAEKGRFKGALAEFVWLVRQTCRAA